MRKLHKGIGRYKGKLPLKCFNCGRVGHFVAKCLYPKQEDSDNEEEPNFKENKQKFKKGKGGNKQRFNKKKKVFYTKDDSSSSEKNEDGESKIIFMGIKDQNFDDNNSQDEENLEVERGVDLEEELICALNELRKFKRKNLQVHEKEYQKSTKEVSYSIKEQEQIIIELKTQLHKAKRNE